MLETVTGKATQQIHKPTERELGRLIIGLRVSYNLVRDRYLGLPKFPTQEELAGMIGCAQSQLSRWCALATLDETVLDLLDTEEINETQARELLPLSRVEQVALVYQIAEKNSSAGRPVSQKDVRAYVQAMRHSQEPWFSSASESPP